MTTFNPRLLVVAALAIAACNEPATENNTTSATDAKDSTTFDISTAKSGVSAANNKFMESIKNGDSAGVASVYAPDALVMPANSESVSGNGIPALWGSFIRMGVKEAKLMTDEVIGNAELLAETGKYEIYMDKNKLLDKGKYVVVWKQVDGSWKMYRDIFTTSMPAAPAKK